MNEDNDNEPNKEELNYMVKFISNKMDSLQKDVLHCLQPPLAPMPAILWCFSCIDLLGSLFTGRASHKGTTEKSRKYMEELMNYTSEQAELILKVFRHKLVHLADPAPLSLYKDKIVAWRYYHGYTLDHLTLLDDQGEVIIKLGSFVHFDQVFTLGITQFMQDIRCSVFKPGGYIEKLRTEADTFQRCKDAICKIDTPQLIEDKSDTNPSLTKS